MLNLRRWILVVLSVCLWVGGCSASHSQAQQPVLLADPPALATFAGGCFWCMEPPFDKLPGVLSTTSGYMGGHTPDPTYKEVSGGNTGHYEVVQVAYDPEVVTYPELLEVFWRNVDPFDGTGQFCDKGDQYRSAIFVGNEAEREWAENSKAALEERFAEPILTAVLPAAPFYPAEDYHQDYYLKNPNRYQFYRYACGRDRRLAEVWGQVHQDPAHEEESH
ncbi:MAG: peptide-methionine (S)-S-oxide reductase MsrA [Thermostichus sp. BF3_bins_97]